MHPTQLRSQLPLLSDQAIILSPDLAMVREGKRLVLFNASGPIYQCKEDDGTAVRLGAVLAVDLGLAGASVVADALRLSRITLHRVRTKYATGGVNALREKKRGPKGPHKLTAAERAGVSEFAIRHAVKRGLLIRASAGESATLPTRCSPAREIEPWWIRFARRAWRPSASWIAHWRAPASSSRRSLSLRRRRPSPVQACCSRFPPCFTKACVMWEVMSTANCATGSSGCIRCC